VQGAPLLFEEPLGARVQRERHPDERRLHREAPGRRVGGVELRQVVEDGLGEAVHEILGQAGARHQHRHRHRGRDLARLTLVAARHRVEGILPLKRFDCRASHAHQRELAGGERDGDYGAPSATVKKAASTTPAFN
jgi:hypothetical protein